MGRSPPQRPLNTDVLIVPRNTEVMFRRVVIGDLVDNLGVRLKRAKTVSEPRRNPNLHPVLGTQNRTGMLPERRRADPDIDADV